MSTQSTGTDETSNFDDHVADHETVIRHAQVLMTEALQLLDSVSAHQSASLLDHAICVLPREAPSPNPVTRRSNEAN